MRAVFIVSAEPLDLIRFCEVCRDAGSANLDMPESLVVQSDWGWFRIENDEYLEGELSDEDREAIKQLVDHPIFAQLQYDIPSAADLAINLMPLTAETWIFNEHGMLWPIGQVRELIHGRKEWQTRLPGQPT